MDSNGVTVSLPSYRDAQQLGFQWGEVDGVTFSRSIRTAYAEIVQWSQNLFKVPSGKAGKVFVVELGHLLRAFAEESAIESIVLMCAMTMPSLLLQKPHRTSKAKDHVGCLERRMKTWTGMKVTFTPYFTKDALYRAK